MRKYANIGTYVMPYNPDDDETRGSKFRGLSYVNAATTSRLGTVASLVFTLHPASGYPLGAEFGVFLTVDLL